MADMNGTTGDDVLYAGGGASGSLVLMVSGSSAEGLWPTFNLLVNGVVVRSNVTVTADHALGATQQVSVSVPAGTTSISIDYTNDVQADYTADRNLYISSVTLNGTALSLAGATYTRDGGTAIAGQEGMYWGGELTFSGAAVQAAAGSSGGIRSGMSIDGGAGLDTVVYNGTASNYSAHATSGGFTLATTTYTDSLVNVERLAFDDVRMALDVNGNAGIAYRLYQAAFDRTPDLPGLGFQMNALDHGWAIWQIAQDFVNSPEFSTTYGSLNDTQFVTQLYQNVLNRAPDQAGLDYHVHNLQTTHSRGDVLAGFSESPENQANVIGSIQNGMYYTL
jgi:hypothetical protein